MMRVVPGSPWFLVVALGMVVGCGGTQVPTHGGYKGKKPRPWDKPKVLKLDKKNAAKADLTLDYARYKRARWLAIDLPGPGSLDVQMDVSPTAGGGGDDGEEEQDMDVGLEILDGTSWNVLARSDLEADDAHELKKQRKLDELPQGRYLIHVYLEGRLDIADVDLKVSFARGSTPWKSDFPNQVGFVDDIAAVPPLDDTPEEKKPTRPSGGHTTRPPRPPPPPPPPTGGGAGSIMAEISDMQPESGGTVITIGGGTSDGLENGLKGSIRGVRNSSFTLTGCGPSTCRARVKAPIDDVRGAAGVTIKLK